MNDNDDKHGMDNEETELDLVMPFLTVSTRGGPHDDSAYAAGWEMGALDAELEHRRPPVLEQLIHAANREQADLIGMKHGYQVDITVHSDEWSYLHLARAGEEK
jgi:hypothetical protein